MNEINWSVCRFSCHLKLTSSTEARNRQRKLDLHLHFEDFPNPNEENRNRLSWNLFATWKTTITTCATNLMRKKSNEKIFATSICQCGQQKFRAVMRIAHIQYYDGINDIRKWITIFLQYLLSLSKSINPRKMSSDHACKRCHTNYQSYGTASNRPIKLIFQ